MEKIPLIYADFLYKFNKFNTLTGGNPANTVYCKKTTHTVTNSQWDVKSTEHCTAKGKHIRAILAEKNNDCNHLKLHKAVSFIFMTSGLEFTHMHLCTIILGT